MAICINRRNPEYVNLSEKFADNFNRADLNAAIGVWQQFNGVERFPSLEEVLGILDNAGINYNLVKAVNTDAIPFEVPNNFPAKKLETFVRNWLNKAGIIVQNVDRILDREGNPINALAQADIVEDIIKVIEGKATPEILSEEAAHFFVEMIAELPLGKELLESVVGTATYDAVVQQYGTAYEGNPIMLQKEAAAKLIAQEIVNIYRLGDENHIIEASPKIGKLRELFNQLIESLKRLFQGTTLSSNHYQQQVSPFRKAAIEFLKGNITTRPVLRTNGKFYHLSPDNRAYRDRVQDLLENMPIQKAPNGPWYLRKRDGKRTARLSDLLKAFYLRIHGEDEKTDTPAARFAAHKGTVLHKWYEGIMRALIAGQTPNYLAVYESVFNEFLEGEIADVYTGQAYYDFLRVSEPQFDLIVNALRGLHKQILHNQEVINQQTGLNETVKIYTEIPIINAAEELGGTLDLLVLYSNGKVGLYDYKNMTFKTDGVTILQGPSLDKIDDFNMRLTQYKNILASQGITEFAESRIIPINVNYLGGDQKHIGFKTIEFQGQNALNTEYLDQISVAHELTGLSDLDKNFLELLYQRLSTLKKIYHTNKTSANKDKVEWTQKAIQSLLLKQDFGYIYGEIIMLYNKFYDDKNRLSSDPKSWTSDELLEIRGILDLYENFAPTFQVNMADKLTPEQTAKLADLDYKLKLLKYAVSHASHDIILESDPDKIDYTKPGKEYKGLGVWAMKLSEFNSPAFQKLGNWVRTSEMKTLRKVQAAEKIIRKAHVELENWTKTHNMSLFDAMAKLYNRKTGTLVRRYSPKFVEDWAAARDKSDMAFMVKYFQIEMVPVPGGYKPTYSKDAKIAFEKSKVNLEEYFARRYPGNTALQQRELTRWIKMHDVFENPNLLFDKNNRFLYKNFKNMDSYISDEFRYIQQNKPLLDYYNMYLEFNKEFSAVTGREIDSRFVANVRDDTRERLKTAGFFTSNTFKLDFLGGMEARDHNNVYAEKEIGQAFDIDGSPRYTVPLMYINPLRGTITDGERAEIKARVAAKYSPTTETILYKAALESAYVEAEREKGLLDKSIDLSTNLLLMTKSVYNYVHMSEIEGLANLLLLEVKDKKVSTQQSEGDMKILDKLSTKLATKFGIPENMTASLESYINMYIYGRDRERDEKPTIINRTVDENGEIVNAGTEIYWSTMVRKAMRWSAQAILGGKPTLIARNFIQVKMNLWLTATEKQWFDYSHIQAATRSAYSDGQKYFAAVEFFLPYGSDPVREMAKNLSAKGLLGTLSADLLFQGLRWTDENVDRNILITMMHSHGIENGEIKQLRYIKSADKRSLYDRMELDKKTGDVTIDGLDFHQLTRFRNMVQTVGSKIKGTTPKSDQMLINTTLMGELLMQYRSWMPGLIKSHFAGIWDGPIYETTLDTVDLGRFTVFLKDVAGFQASNAQSLAQMLAASVPILGLLAQKNMKTNEAAARAMYNQFKAENPDSSYTFEQFLEMRVNKLKAAAIEFQAVLSFFLLMILAKSAVPDDDDNPVESFLTKNIYRVLHGAYLEASFFILPSSLQELARSPFALLGFAELVGRFFANTADELRDDVFGENDKRDPSPRLKYMFKLTPGVGGMSDFFNVFDDFNPTKR